jgi:hypothetical protein
MSRDVLRMWPSSSPIVARTEARFSKLLPRF